MIEMSMSFCIFAVKSRVVVVVGDSNVGGKQSSRCDL